MAEDDLFDSNPASGKAEGAYNPTRAQVPSDAPTPPDMGGPPPRYSGISRSQSRARSRYGSGEVTPDDSADIVPPGLILDQTQLSVEPGQSAQFSAIIENQSTRYDHFTLQVKGIPAEWLQELPNRVDLEPDQRSGSLPITISPPKTSQSKAGPYTITVTAVSQVNPAQTTDAGLTLNVAPFAEFSSDVWPERIRSGRSVQLTITNKGNSPQNYTLRGRDPDEKVDFEFPRRQVLVEAGQAASSRIGLSARRRPWFREPTEADQASLEVVSPENKVQEHQIDLVSTPILNAWWVFPLVLLLCLGGTGAAVWQAWPTPTPTVTSPPPTESADVGGNGGGEVLPLQTSEPTPTSTPILPAPTLKFIAIPQTIKQDQSATLKWEAANLVNNDKLLLNHVPILVITNTTNVLTFTTSYTEVSPDFNTTYTLEIQRPPTLTAIISATLAITVLKRVDVTFGIFPGGGYVPLGYILNGDEFKALGVRLTIEKDELSSGCRTRNPAVGLWSDHGSAPYLTTLVPKLNPQCEDCEEIICKSLPLTIHFLRPVREASIFTLKPTNAVEVQLEGSPTSTPKNIKLETNFSSPDKNITRVDIGAEAQPPAVIKLQYFYIAKEEDTYQDCSPCNY